MGKSYESINPRIRKWIEKQEMFFVATAPMAAEGSVNLSPKGMDTLRVLDEDTLAFLDSGGSGIETIAHLRENGRIVVMMCAFRGPAKIYRFHGRGSVVLPGNAEFDELVAQFDRTHVGIRSIIRIDVTRVSDSCGFGVPLYDFRAQRKESTGYIRRNGVDYVRAHFAEMNGKSIDGLPGLTAEESAAYVGPREEQGPD
ncbi:MAG: pyridoxamine 5'-phosphate oxidase family protein [Gammaproteobacteria bacterium]|nr:pyridoxamine 5'-phosphate oxidase family protein [Gammaproteobacteria bacterium]